MTGHRTSLPGWRYKDGKLVKSTAKQSVSTKIRQRKSKKITVKRR